PLYRVPSYEPSFMKPGNVGQLLDDTKFQSLADRLGSESGGLLNTPLGDLDSGIANRVARIDPELENLGGQLSQANSIPVPFNISQNPRVSEAMANQMANIHGMGLGALAIPSLMTPLRPGEPA